MTLRTAYGTGEIYASRDDGGEKLQRVLIGSDNGPSVDAFGRFRVSEPVTIFDSKLLHGSSQPLFWDEVLTGIMAVAAPTLNKPYLDWTSTNVTAGTRTRQTFRRFNYQPGKSQLILMSGVLELSSGVKTGCVRQIGMFDGDNGAFFESNAGIINTVTRSKDSGVVVDTTVAQASWNIDTMDGSGGASNPSGVLLDITKSQIFVIDFQWLSAGRVRFGFEINGTIIYVCNTEIANVGIIPWASTPNLPLRYAITTTTDSGVCSMRVICASVVAEGGTDDVGTIRYKSTAGAAITTVTENILYAVIGIRLKSDFIGTTIKMLRMAMQTQTNSEFIEWVMLFNPTVAGTFTYGDLSNSAVQTALGVTANTVTNGEELAGGYLESGKDGGSDRGVMPSALVLGSAIDGTLDTIVLCARPIGGVGAVDIEGSMIWRELT